MAVAIIGNVGNVGYALPMVSVNPTDISKQYVLAWDPVNLALNYVPFAVDAIGNLTVAGSIAATGTITGAAGLAITGSGTFSGAVTAQSGLNAGPAGVTQASLTPGGTPQLSLATLKVVGPRQTGWTVGTGTPQKTTFATSTVTLAQLAGVVLSLQTDLITHGLIGP